MTVATDPRKTGISAPATLLAASAVAVSVTGTVNETALATVTIPAGAMGINGGIEVRAVWSNTANANTKTTRIRHGGVAGASISVNTLTTNPGYSDVRRTRNRGSASSQVTSSSTSANSNPFGVVVGAITTTAVDTTVAQDLVLTGQLTVISDTLTLESYEVWLLP